ncbi:MAG TPA: enoyl-CoA hydratase/isomerase family protein [Bacillota bacterium]|nr:enoyl-CoA hydratase/isomerase family protein [Bacillota bacterium]
MKFQEILVEESEDGIGIIRFNRPEKRNAITIQMRREISACLSNWKHTPRIGVVIFTGVGSSFSAGFDLTEFTNPNIFGDLLDSSSRYHRDIWYFTKPIISAINGLSLGGGFDLATLCDIRLCSKSASFGHPEIKFGAPPIITPLKWIVGEGHARNLCLTGRKIDSEEAYRIGLVSEVVEDDELLQRATHLAKTILEAPIDTLEFTKTYFIANSGKGFEESFYLEHDKAFQEILLKKAKKSFNKL